MSQGDWDVNYPNTRNREHYNLNHPNENRATGEQRNPFHQHNQQEQVYRRSGPVQQPRYELDPNMMDMLAKFGRNMQQMGKSRDEIENLLTKSMEFEQHERVSLNSRAEPLYRSSNSDSTNSKLHILLVVLFIIAVVLGIIIYGRAQEPKRYDLAGLNDQEQDGIVKLLMEQQIDIFKFTRQYSDSPNQPRQIAQLKSILESARRFIIVAVAQNNNQNHVFGTFIDKRQLSKSFIYSLNHRSILPVERETMAWEVNPRLQTGPKFGKSDIQFFVFTSSGYDSMSNLCYNYKCPLGIEYGTDAANRYLAGEQIFRTQYFTILVENNSDL